MKSKKTFFGRLVTLLCLTNLLSLLIYYFTTYVFANAASAYVFYFYTETVRVIIPAVSALAIFVTYATSSLKKCFLRTLYCTLPWLIYLLPYNAYKYAYGGLLIEDVLLWATVETLFILLMLYLLTLILSAVMIGTSHVFLKVKAHSFRRSAVLDGDDPLDFSTPSSIGIFAGCLPIFIYNLVNEIIDTVNFISYADGVYEISEIVYMLIKYAFILGMLILSYFTAHKLKKLLNE